MMSPYYLNLKSRFMLVQHALHLSRIARYTTARICDPMNLYIAKLEQELLPMAKRKKVQNNFGGVEFCTLKLSASDKKEFQAWVKEQIAREVDCLIELLTDAWKISFSFDAEHDTYIASCTQKDEDSVNYNICVTSRSDDAIEALWMNYFKMVVLASGKKLPTERLDDNWG